MVDSVTCVRLLLDLGTVNISCRNGQPPLHAELSLPLRMVALGNASLNTMLFSHNELSELHNECITPACYMSPVFLASRYGKPESLQLLLNSLAISGTVF